ncbi:MAG: response regulator [Symploca sp. SIO1B1]|nr:response regulator [Symploca sp. SIO1B1]
MTHLHPILLVKDNLDDEMLSKLELKRSKVQKNILVARNGEEALATIFNAKALPWVVLLDLKLPKIDGLEVLRRIRTSELTHLLPVIILTSSSQDCDIIESYGLGANSYVCKPINFDQFINAVSQLALYWALINEPLPEDL